MPKDYLIDLHTHSKYAQATSKDLDLLHMEAGCRRKGIDVMGTGDFTHPLWQKELRAGLTERDGLGWTKTGFPFVYSTEISLIYRDKGRGRKTHNVVLAPSMAVVMQITEYLLRFGRVDYDGRPIFGIPCPQFVSDLRAISKDIEVIPAHIWTPWFSMFGSNSGWDSMTDCFEDQTKHIHCVETGLSSDPAMNWRLSQLDNVNIVSFSDAHSPHPWRIGREATILTLEKLSYRAIIEKLRTLGGITKTIEVEPAYGKYHIDGHRACGIVWEPSQTKKHNGICPVCKQPVTRGVLGRVEELADRSEGYKRTVAATPYETLLPLHEVLSFTLGKALATKTVGGAYEKLVHATTEFHVLRAMPFAQLVERSDPTIAQAIIAMREGKVSIEPGYDGVYGKPTIKGVTPVDSKRNKQKRLGEF